jgi:hypothetical protein
MKMSDQNITVIVQQAWEVLVLRDYDQKHGELITDAGFESYAEALEYAAKQADQHGVGITYTHGGAG